MNSIRSVRRCPDCGRGPPEYAPMAAIVHALYCPTLNTGNTEMNVDMEVKGDKLVMTVDLKKAGVVSKSGKTMIIAGTGGFVATGHANGSKVSVNVTVPKSD